MLLPILMPPVATEFRDELLFPQELYPYQRAGVKWLFESDCALLADDMGLGKTVQAITAFHALVRRGKAKQALVVCPKSVLTNWMRELERWAPELVAMRIHGNQSTRHVNWRAYVGKCHVLLTTYDTLRQDREYIRGRPFDLVVADEVQRIKNPDTAISRAVRSLPAQRRWGLTGTPLENKLEDIVTVFGFVKPGLFRPGESTFLTPAAVRERVRPYMLRRLKKDALPDLPQKVIDTKLLELPESQRRAYDQAERGGVDRLRGTREVTVQHVLALIQQLKQICNFDPKTGESAKVEFLQEEFLETACEDDGKALVISQYVNTLEELEKRLAKYKPLVYTGQLSTKQRDDIEEAFKSTDENKVLLLSLRAGGLGLNLTRANYVLHFDRWWNPAVELQAEDRTHRIGQYKGVFVTRLICQHTIEERIERLLERKKILFQEVVDELADVSLERVLSEEELFALFDLTPPRRTRRGVQESVPVTPPEPTVPQQPAVMAITPETPYSNLLSLRQILRTCERYIWWADRYFNARGLEELAYTIDPAVVREVRILSGPDRVDDRAKREFERFRDEMARKGVSTEWRVLKGFAHDRFIVSEKACFLVPSIDTILRGQYSQMIETPDRPPFDNWWGATTPIADYKP
jgi:SNF2 family DNA or RNA helicase